MNFAVYNQFEYLNIFWNTLRLCMRLFELMFQNGGHIKMAQNLSTSLFRCYLAKKYKYKTVLKEKLMIGSFFFYKILIFQFHNCFLVIQTQLQDIFFRNCECFCDSKVRRFSFNNILIF
jgi:hypothetical protein